MAKNETEASEPKVEQENVLRDETTGEPVLDLATASAEQVIAAVKAGKLYKEDALIYEHQQRTGGPRKSVVEALSE